MQTNVAVCRWIEQNATALDESSGAEVLSVDGRQTKLRKQTKEGTFTLVFDHEPEQSAANRQRQFRTVLVKSDNPTLVSRGNQHPRRTRGKRLARDDHRSGHGQHTQRDVDLARNSALRSAACANSSKATSAHRTSSSLARQMANHSTSRLASNTGPSTHVRR